MNSRDVPTAGWLLPLGVLIAAIGIDVTDLGGFAGSVHSYGAAFFYDFVPGVVNRALQRPRFADQAEPIFLIVAGVVVIVALARAKIAWAAGVTIVTIGAAVAMSWMAARQDNFFLDFLYSSLVLACLFAVGVLVRLAAGDGEGKRLEQALKNRLPAAAMREISRRPERLNRNGETRVMSYLVCGIRGFTELTENYTTDAPGLARLLRRVMAPLTEAVLANGGTIDRNAPGKITAFFNAPLDDPDHAVHACAAALRMADEVKALNRVFAEERGAKTAPIEIGIGVNTGPGIVSDFGIAVLDYTVVGRAAARAEELKQLSAFYGFPVIVGETTRAAAEQRLAFLQIDLSPGAEGEGSPIFAALGNHQVRSSPKFRALQTFHRSIFEAYGAQDWHRTRELIAQCRALSGASQRLYELYLERVAQLEANPPEDVWDGNLKSAAT